MAVVSYSKKKQGKVKLSEHFRVEEFACKDGSDTILINSDLITILEQLHTLARQKYNIKAINVNSGYRTPSHSVKVGGYATDQHTKGNAADIWLKLPNGSRLGSKEICLMLEDLNHQGGIGYISSNAVHVDVRGKKCWFDETKNERTTTSWYSYFGITKPQNNSSPEKYLTLTTNVYGREGGYGFSKKKILYKKGTIVKNITMNVGSANGYKWFKGYVNNQLRYFPYKENWYK